MKDQDERLPDREQIEAIKSLTALEALLADVIEAKLEIETQLDHSSRDEEWERRAIGALAAHRICEHNVRRQIGRLTGRQSSNAEAEATRALAKAQNIQNMALQEKNSIARKQLVATDVQVKALLGIRKAMSRANFLVHFHEAAHDVLTEEVCRAISDDAHRRLVEAATMAVEEVAGVGALAAE